MESTVIADAVNLAARIESLTKFYGVEILISGGDPGRSGEGKYLPDALSGRGGVKGRTDAVKLYEVSVLNGFPSVDRFLEDGLPENWDGIQVFHHWWAPGSIGQIESWINLSASIYL